MMTVRAAHSSVKTGHRSFWRLMSLGLWFWVGLLWVGQLSAADFTAVDAAQSRGEYQQASVLLNQMRAGNEQSCEWLWRMARAEFDLGYQLPDKDPRSVERMKRGLEYARKAVAADSRSAMAHRWYASMVGKVAMTLGPTEKIKVAYEVRDHALMAVKLNPRDDVSLQILGRWNYELSDLSWAEKKAAELLFSKLPDASLQDAFKYMSRAYALAPHDLLNCLWLAKTHLRLGKEAEARKLLQQAVRARPLDTAGKRDLAEAQALLKKLE